MQVYYDKDADLDIIKNKKDKIIVDLGPTPDKKYSADYQSGALSFEIFHDKEKVITNCGYFQNYNHKLNILSKSTAAHSTLSIDDRSLIFAIRYLTILSKIFQLISQEKN